MKTNFSCWPVWRWSKTWEPGSHQKGFCEEDESQRWEELKNSAIDRSNNKIHEKKLDLFFLRKDPRHVRRRLVPRRTWQKLGTTSRKRKELLCRIFSCSGHQEDFLEKYKKRSQMKPYKLHRSQEFCKWIIDEAISPNKIIFNDEKYVLP